MGPVAAKTMVEQLLGSYHLDRNENFEEFLAATGVPLIARKMMVSVSPKITIAKEEDKITVTFKILIKSFPLTFELGKEFEEDNPISGEKNKVWRERMNFSQHSCLCPLGIVRLSQPSAVQTV